MEREVIGDCVLFLGDAAEIVPTLARVDVVVTDPPYGVNRSEGFERCSGGAGFARPTRQQIIARRGYTDTWDVERAAPALMQAVLRLAPRALIWGGQFYTDVLPVGGHWVVWDKVQSMPTFGDCELAWTNMPRQSVKKVVVEWNGLLGKEETRWHPTQKPLKLLRWVIREYSRVGEVICDPFAGSFTTGVACAELGRGFIGVERERKYFDLGCQRITDAYQQPVLVQDVRAISTQLSLEGW